MNTSRARDGRRPKTHMAEKIKKAFRPVVLGNCLGMVIVGFCLLFAASFLVECYTHHGESVEVPDLRGLSYDEAEDRLNDLGLDIAVNDTGYVKTLPPDVVLDQSEATGKKIKPGRTVYVVINSAHPRAIVLPDVSDNSSLREAEARLRAIGFQLDSCERVHGDLDWVYGVKVNGKIVPTGSRIYVDQKLTLVVGDGNVEDEFNGDDSLDAAFFTAPEPEMEDPYAEEAGYDDLDGIPTSSSPGEEMEESEPKAPRHDPPAPKKPAPKAGGDAPKAAAAPKNGTSSSSTVKK